MRLNMYDTVFSAKGEPGVVVGKDPNNNTLKVEREGPTYEATRQNGFINGLTPEDRTQFNTIISQVKEIKEPNEKVVKLAQAIDELKADPKNYHLVRYLNSELAHLMYSENISPRQYTTDISMVS